MDKDKTFCLICLEMGELTEVQKIEEDNALFASPDYDCPEHGGITIHDTISDIQEYINNIDFAIEQMKQLREVLVKACQKM